jgi:hypothetical protein
MSPGPKWRESERKRGTESGLKRVRGRREEAEASQKFFVFSLFSFHLFESSLLSTRWSTHSIFSLV